VFCDILAMSKAVEIAANPIVARIDKAIEAKGGSREAVSKRALLDRGYLQKIAARPDAIPRASTLLRLAEAAGIPQDELLKIAKCVDPASSDGPAVEARADQGARIESDAAPMVPILGFAEGAILSSLGPINDTLGYVSRPPGLIGVRDAYAIYVHGDSMTPRHKSGELRFVHPLRKFAHGDDVVIQTLNGEQEPEAFIKTFDHQTSEWLFCRQLSPDAEIRYAKTRIKSVHKVMTLNELFNL